MVMRYTLISCVIQSLARSARSLSQDLGKRSLGYEMQYQQQYMFINKQINALVKKNSTKKQKQTKKRDIDK